ncbi:nucleotide pyrophosphohydrolase [Thalassospira mesophila]|uniref:Nucleotide pyrophosphohydrolase n=1 Tax=Thalassospira mesophila TaxID=1293891 RepID=A0A1Y2L1M8_9PROT|nr:nucleotide pyrophosphohydrolase [Thalassospira mesophila]OSQ39371.1 nucleotide pyrophosphohydrolase [Thalassospira mesophila]
MENQARICAWAEQTFGPVGDPVALVDRAMLEMNELRDAVKTRDIGEIGKESADVVILLHRLVAQFGLDLHHETDAKMTINRNRTWQVKGDGTGSHV